MTNKDELAELHREREKAAHERHLRSQYRQGARGSAEVAAHNRETTERRRNLVRAQFAGDVEARLLAMLTDGRQLHVAADKLGLRSITILRRGDWDPEWRERLDAALMAGRNPDIPHGSSHSHRFYGCRCPECREAKRMEAGPRR